MARVARIPLADEALAVLGSALRDPNVVLRYQAKIVTVPDTKEPDISARRSMNSSDWRFVPAAGAALCDLADKLPAAVLAALLGISVDTAGRWAALVKRDWAGYIAEQDGQTLGPEQT